MGCLLPDVRMNPPSMETFQNEWLSECHAWLYDRLALCSDVSDAIDDEH